MNYSPGFDAFWAAWPQHSRKTSKRKCYAKWCRDDLEQLAKEVAARVHFQVATDQQWAKDDGAFIEAPLVWLNTQRWDDDGAALEWWQRKQEAVRRSLQDRIHNVGESLRWAGDDTTREHFQQKLDGLRQQLGEVA